MPFMFSAIIGFVRFVIGQGRKLSWVRGSLLYSVFYKNQEPLDKRELMNFLVKSSGYGYVRYPSPVVKWFVSKDWFPFMGIPMIPSFSNISNERVSHFMPRPQ